MYLTILLSILTAQPPQTGLLQITRDDSFNRAPSWHPDGRQIAFESDRRGNWDIFVVDRMTGAEDALTESDANDRYPAWSPSGNAVVFVSDRRGTPELHLLHMRTGRVEHLVSVAGEEMFPAWAPDGRAIIFSLATDDAVRVMTLTLDDRVLTPLVTDPYASVWPRWSPNGAQVAFFSRRDTDGVDDEVYVFTPSTGETRRVTDRPGHDFCPAWNPDGTLLALVSLFDNGERALRIVRATDGGEQARLATSNFRVTEPVWSPDGAAIAYAARTSADASYQIYVEVVPQAAR